jgi:hypothetical protein
MTSDHSWLLIVINVFLNSVDSVFSMNVRCFWGSSDCSPFWRMLPSGMLRRVALVRTDGLEELSVSIQIQSIVFLRSMRWLLVTANVAPTSLIPVTLMMEALSSSETSVLTRATWRNILDSSILHSHRHENLKSYTFTILFKIYITVWMQWLFWYWWRMLYLACKLCFM